MEEKNKHILKKAFEQLPEFKADTRIWDKIEHALDNDVRETNQYILKKSINKLPESIADENIWNKIEKELDSKPEKSIRLYLLKIAASVIVVIGVSILIKNGLTKNTQKESITFSQETIPNNVADISSPGIEQELVDLIQKQCRIQPGICMNPTFTELNEELTNLTRSLDEIKILSKNSNNDPEIYKYMLRIQKERTQISKKLLQFFNS